MKSGEAFPKTEVITLPLYTYSYDYSTNTLHATNLMTGESCVRAIRSFQFKIFSSWCALPYPYICFTGGSENTKTFNEVVTIAIQREFAVQMKSPMISARAIHNSVWYEGFLYVLSGYNFKCKYNLNECERYSFEENQWETIPSIPTAVRSFGVIQLNDNRAIYVFGGATNICSINLIQELSLERLEWRILELKLPNPAPFLSVFKVRETECYFVDEAVLYCFVPSASQIHQVKILSSNIKRYFGPSYYSQGILYCSSFIGANGKFAIESLF